ncbi:type I restriction enzyme subunit R domain-containing protein [Paludibacterium denitrificans]|uniref:type I restriction enzyme subunit R domain-containing protein n=1 Tax=Paludibacterium denitrificans TaxID=2675226 RepID=UPI001E63D78C|nr:hypothetical protein [Paludibacterium denitrificans]
MQKRIKDQQYPNADLPHSQKIDITIVVDMLLTGFDSKYLNTLYVDKNLKYHGLIQGLLAHQPRLERQQALWQCARLPPAAKARGRGHHAVLGQEDQQPA